MQKMAKTNTIVQKLNWSC